MLKYKDCNVWLYPINIDKMISIFNYYNSDKITEFVLDDHYDKNISKNDVIIIFCDGLQGILSVEENPQIVNAKDKRFKKYFDDVNKYKESTYYVECKEIIFFSEPILLDSYLDFKKTKFGIIKNGYDIVKLLIEKNDNNKKIIKNSINNNHSYEYEIFKYCMANNEDISKILKNEDDYDYDCLTEDSNSEDSNSDDIKEEYNNDKVEIESDIIKEESDNDEIIEELDYY